MAHICDRCGKESGSYILSMFNLDELCLDCKDQEEKHPLYRFPFRTDRRYAPFTPLRAGAELCPRTMSLPNTRPGSPTQWLPAPSQMAHRTQTPPPGCR